MKRLIRQKKFFAAVFALLFAAALLSAQDIREGAAAPDFSLTLSTGEQVKRSDYEGKALLLHFWATWCPPCIVELPHLNALSEQLGDGNNALSFLAVCVSDTEKRRADFMQKNGYTFTGGLDATGEIAMKYAVQGIPTSVLIGRDGKIEKIHVGMMNSSQLAAFVAKYE